MVSYVANKNFNKFYLQAYNPATRESPNFGYKQHSFGQVSQGVITKQQLPPGYVPQAQPEKKVNSTDDLLAQLVKSQQKLMHAQAQFMQAQQVESNNTNVSIKNLEEQLGKLAQEMQDCQAGPLPNNTQNNLKE